MRILQCHSAKPSTSDDDLRCLLGSVTARPSIVCWSRSATPDKE